MRVGISGWRYAGWRGKFHPTGLPRKEELKPPPRRKERDVYVTFDNDIKAHAPADAARLERKRVRLPRRQRSSAG